MKIYIRQSLLNKLNYITNTYSHEVGGYLLGEIKGGIIYLQDLLIPRQNVSSTSVEITPESQLELRRTYRDKCNRIIGHWHSHHTMGAFWSATDEENMKNFMIRKDLFIFLVTSTTNHKVRVSLRDPLNFDIDDCELEVSDLTFQLLRKRVDSMINNNNNWEANTNNDTEDSIHTSREDF